MAGIQTRPSLAQRPVMESMQHQSDNREAEFTFRLQAVTVCAAQGCRTAIAAIATEFVHSAFICASCSNSKSADAKHVTRLNVLRFTE